MINIKRSTHREKIIVNLIIHIFFHIFHNNKGSFRSEKLGIL